MKIHRIAFLISHPIQYFSPLFQRMAAHPQIDLTVFYCSDESIRGGVDREFGRPVTWDIPLLEGYRYRFLPNRSWKPSIFRGYWGLWNPRIVLELRRDRFDALIVHGWSYATHWLAVSTAWARGIPVYLRGENPLVQEGHKALWKRGFKRVLHGKILFSLVDKFLTIGRENHRFYRHYGIGEEDLISFPYCVDNERFLLDMEKEREMREKRRRKRGISSDQMVVIFVGKLIRKKRPLDLLEAVHKTSTKEVVLLYVGEGELESRLKEEKSRRGMENVHFAGFVNQSELAQYYSLADVLVLPSEIGETWGLVVNEAMNFSLPIIVSNMVGCAPDLVREGENGYVFPLGDIEALAGCLQTLVGDRDLREKMGRRSREIVADYSYEKGIENLVDDLNRSTT